ncbi:MAG: tetraacyldisaccharide 4'-kinase [Candidatus Zipacnadales bacterium]
MSVTQYWKAVTDGEIHGLAADIFRFGLHLLSAPLWLALQTNLAVYRWGLRKQIDVGCPVLVVGNLSMGGTGKTTATIFLVRRLAAVGRRAGVILRGYRRKASVGPLLVSDGHRVLASPVEGGDEAVLLAEALPGHPVAVGVRREKVAQLLLGETKADSLVLDDGFQYFRLARYADIVLIDASHKIEQDRLCPSGRLREPVTHLRRATQAWITHAELVPEARIVQLRHWIDALVPGLPIVVTEHRPTGLRSLTGAPTPPRGSRVVGVSALGNPRSFEASLQRLGYDVCSLALPDHHRYEPSDWLRIAKMAQQHAAQHVITTEKDAVKLPSPPAELGSVHVLGCELNILAGEEHVHQLLEALK